MTYAISPSVQVGAWASVSANSEITYHVRPEDDMIEFILGGRNGRNGLELDMTEGGLHRCIATFTEALNAFEAAAASLR